MKMKIKVPGAKHQEIRNDVLAAIKGKMGAMPADEILAVLSYTVGQLVAMQDQRSMTPAMAMQIVAVNIEAGNQASISELMNSVGGAA